MQWDPASNAMVFRVRIGAKLRTARAAEISWDRGAWQAFCRTVRRRKWAARIVDRLLDLEENSDPAHGEKSARDKDERAFDALLLVGRFAETFAGWAIRHKIGMALDGRETVPWMPSGLRDDPEHLSDKEVADDHRHEALGAQPDCFTGRASADTNRKLLMHMLEIFTPIEELSRWRAEIANALPALNYGSTPEVFRPTDTTSRHSYEIRQLEIRAIEFMWFRRGRDGRGASRAAITEVANAYGIASETVASWQKRLRVDFGRLEISRRVEFAKRAGANFAAAMKRMRAAKPEDQRREAEGNADVLEVYYSDAALHDCGTRYKQMLKSGAENALLRT
jgi:hypothetical protein